MCPYNNSLKQRSNIYASVVRQLTITMQDLLDIWPKVTHESAYLPLEPYKRTLMPSHFLPPLFKNIKCAVSKSQRSCGPLLISLPYMILAGLVLIDRIQTFDTQHWNIILHLVLPCRSNKNRGKSRRIPFCQRRYTPNCSRIRRLSKSRCYSSSLRLYAKQATIIFPTDLNLFLQASD